ncbi:TonB-dependent receptor [Aquimarina sp. U1-2]|uniref:TonB-dependent receptor n=1 Tax=Aquimarina sp. U1-2 TaxID=2823141 RepID=UPI001AEC79BD|nr:TonB-dependent receptor [Aquimarina sp. U1-2]MBP2832379.1 TonB-dependent receptor [Aquimarina sp. U1-2]
MGKFYLIVLLWLPLVVFSQDSFTISGKVVDDNRLAIPFANVVLSLDNKYAITDENGRYRMDNIKPGRYSISVSSLGFKTQKTQITITKNLTQNFILTTTVEDLDNVLVTGKTKSKLLTENVVAITSLDIQKSKDQALGVEDVLKQSTGVVVRQSGGLGSNLNINLNGLTGQAVRTYYDGMPIELYGGALQLNFIPVDALERLDIYKGIIPVNVGTDALGGGLNLVPLKIGGNILRTSYSVGSFNTHRFSLHGNYNFNENLSASISSFINYTDNDYEMRDIPNIVENLRTDGTVESITEERINATRFHDRFRSSLVEASLSIHDVPWADELQVSALFSKRDNQIQQGTFITGLAVGEAETEATVVVQKLNYKKAFFKEKLKFNYSGLYARSINTTNDSTTAFYNWRGERLVTENSRGSEIFGIPIARKGESIGTAHRITASYAISDNVQFVISEFNYGIEIDGEDPIGTRIEIDGEQIDPNTIPSKLRSNVFGTELNTTFFDKKLTAIGFYKNYDYSARSIEFIASGITEIPLRTVKSNNDGFGFGVKYQMSTEIFLRSSFERTLRLPTQNEVFGDFAAIVPNFELRPEQSNNINVGARYEKNLTNNRFISLDVSGFLRDQENLIRPVPFGPENSQFINEANVESIGIELGSRFRPFSNLSFNGSFTYQQLEIGKSNDIRSSGGSEGSSVPNIPNLFFNVTANYTLENIFRSKNNLELSWNYLFVDRFSVNEVIDLDSANPAFVVPRQHLNNANISYILPEQNLVCSLAVQNIFDQEIFDNFRIPRPGINYAFKISYSLQ